MTPTTIQECLEPLVARWAPPHNVRAPGVLQYVLTTPLADGITGVIVTFKDGEAVATIGTSESPDLVLTLSATDFLLLAEDQLDLILNFSLKRASLEQKTPEAMRLLRHLGNSYHKRPTI